MLENKYPVYLYFEPIKERMNELLLIVLAYLIGSIPTALIISKFFFISILEIMEVETWALPIPFGYWVLSMGPL